jgi:hypothetical protein
MSRSQGLLLDNMIEAELILANGEPAVVSSDHLPDLFWVSTPSRCFTQA